MTEVAFPLFGTAIVLVIVLPAFSLLAKLALVLSERDASGGPLQGLTVRYLLLAGSSGLPLAWFFSAGLHQAESGKSALACLFDHDATALCFESGFFALILAAVVLARSFGVVRGLDVARASRHMDAEPVVERLAHIVEGHPMLHALRGRVSVTDATGFALGTYGWLEPRVFVGIDFAASVTDEMLASALEHENAHVRSLDPLRYLALQLALAVNPFGRWLLDPHVKRWYAAHEAHCDREAVIRGARPLPLADAIVRAARPSVASVALGARDTSVLEFRISMLIAFAERQPSRSGAGGLPAFPTTVALLIIALLLPHQTGTGALDALHTGAEHALTYFWP
jgi:hypothetical protein